MNAIKLVSKKCGLVALAGLFGARALSLFAYCVVAACLLFQTPVVRAFGLTECAASRFGSDLNCTANDVSITGIAVTGSTATCTGGGTVTLDLDLTVNFASPTRYDIGIFIANDGKNPQLLASSGGAATCSVAALPSTSPFLNANANVCGDGNNGINGGIGKGVVSLTGVTVPCQTNTASGGNLYIPYVVSWSQSAGNACTGPNDVVPATTSKCNVSDPALQSVNVMVMPEITNTDGITTIAPGDTNTYYVTITNSTGISISNAVFKDPAVANLTVDSVTCAAAGGATCPTAASITVADMQGAGITIPPLPNGGSVTFTIDATLSASAAGLLSNVASLTLNGKTVSVTDTDTVVVSSYAYYAMDEASWAAGASVLDSSGNGRNATRVGTTAAPTDYPVASPPGSAIAGTPGTCGSASIPLNTLNTLRDGVSLPIAPQILGGGTSGSIMFWYNSNTAWNAAGTDRMLLDASTGASINSPAFWVMKKANGSVIWSFTDAFGWTHNVTSSTHNFAANTWHHIAISWKFVENNFLNPVTMDLYIDGVKENTTYGGNGMFFGMESCTSGYCSLNPSIATIYIGDNRTNGVTPTTCAAGFFGFCGAAISGTGNSANGAIDEVYVFDASATLAKVTAVKNSSHACATPINHYELSIPANNVACLGSTVTVTACADSSSPCTNPSTAVSGNTAVLTTTGGVLGSGTLAFNASGVASTTLSYPAAADGTAVSVTLSGESAAAVNPRTCCQGGVCAVANSCSAIFNTAGFVISDTAAGAAWTVPTQVAGVTSPTSYLRAVKTGSATKACEAALGPGTTSVNFAYQCNNPTVCSSSNLMTVNGGVSTPIARNNNGSVTSYVPVNLTFDANGSAPFTFTYQDVGQVTLSASKGASGTLLTTLAGSSNPFVVKPDHFDIANVKRTSDGMANPAATGAGGGVFVKAGESFTATVTAMSATGAATPNYGKETTPQGVRLQPTLVLPAGGNSPALTNAVIGGVEFGSTGQAVDANGVATVTNLAWDEAGIITLNAIADNAGANNYLNGGAVLGATTGTVGNVGRFYPDRFALTAGAVTNRADISACADTFTYFGEQLNAVFNLTAQSLGGATTRNYVGAFAKLDPTVFGNLQMGAVDRTTVLTPGPPYLLTPVNTGMPIITCGTSPCWALGVASQITVPFMFARPAAPSGPYASVDVGINPADSDGVTVPFDIDTATATNPAGTPNKGKLASTALRYGRMMIPNSYGSELFALPINIVAQYWNGSAYLANTLDNCTSLVNTNFVQAAGAGGAITTTIAGGGTIAAGIGRITLTKPTAFAAKGSVDITSNIPYLPGRGRETFGVYKAGPVIYIRELY